MSSKSTKSKAFGTIGEAEVLQILEHMEKDAAFNTESHYAADTIKYPNNVIKFSQKHIEHLRKFPSINPLQYISNLKLMTRSR